MRLGETFSHRLNDSIRKVPDGERVGHKVRWRVTSFCPKRSALLRPVFCVLLAKQGGKVLSLSHSQVQGANMCSVPAFGPGLCIREEDQTLIQMRVQ